MIPILALAVGCGKEAATEVCSLPARAATTPVAGDANGDGAVDIADGAYVLTGLFRGGPAPACTAASDLNGDAVIDVGDGVGLWNHLFAGTTALPTLAAGACAKVDRTEATCGDGLEWSIDAADAAGAPENTATLDATVLLATGPLTVDALSVAVHAEGCTITGATFAGTQAADRRDSPSGRRDGGYARADVVSDGALASVAWDIAGDAALPPSEAPASVLALTVEAFIQGECTPCTLSLTGPGTVVSAGGYAYVPALATTTVQVCPG